MRYLRNHPIPTLGGLLALAFGLFLLSASGVPGTYWSNGPRWVGNVGWYGWLAAALLFVLAAGYSLVRFATRARTTRSRTTA